MIKRTCEDRAPERVNFCEQPKISNHFIDTIQRNVKTTKGSYNNCGKWDALPMDVRVFLTECAEYMLSLEVVAKEGIEIKQKQEAGKGKILYERRSYVYAVGFQRTQNSEPEMGYLINEETIVDVNGQPVAEVYDYQSQEENGALTLYVPVCGVNDPIALKAAERSLKEAISRIKGKYHSAQSRQYNGDRPSGRMYGLGEAIDILEDTLAKVKKGDYDV